MKAPKAPRKLYALINQMSSLQDTYGTVISVHRTIEAAQRAGVEVQPRERGSYLPVTVVEVSRSYPRGYGLGHAQGERVDLDERDALPASDYFEKLDTSTWG